MKKGLLANWRVMRFLIAFAVIIASAYFLMTPSERFAQMSNGAYVIYGCFPSGDDYWLMGGKGKYVGEPRWRGRRYVSPYEHPEKIEVYSIPRKVLEGISSRPHAINPCQPHIPFLYQVTNGTISSIGYYLR